MITINNLTNNGTLADATSFTTASITPTANRLILVTVGNQSTSGTANTPTVTGAGMTWTQIATVNNVSTRRLTLFRGVSATPSSGTFTIDFAGQTQTNCDWSINEVKGAKISGTNGSSAIVQNNTLSQTGTHSGISITLSAFSSSRNATFGACRGDALLVTTPGANFTALSSGDAGTKYCSTEYAQTNQTTIDWSWSSASSTADYAIAIELAASPGSGFFSFL